MTQLAGDRARPEGDAHGTSRRGAVPVHDVPRHVRATAHWNGHSGGHSNGHAHEHAVQFYEGAEFLAGVIADYVRDGLAAGQPALVITSAPRWAAVEERLASTGVNVDAARERGLLTVRDARATLAGFMDGARPDPARFRATVGPLLPERAAGDGRGMRAYGDMVELLWAEGNGDAAVRLETLWNELAGTHAFSLLCAYDMGGFASEAHAAQLEAICHAHGHVVPTERWTGADDGARLREIALLQQRARALESEVEHRRALEQELRATLAEREELLARAEAARREAVAANRAKSDFLAVMSHELRTPLNAIGGHVQLMELGIHGPVTDEQRDALERVQRSQRHLLALINDVLNLARIESGHVEYATTDVALGPLVADVAATVAPLLAAKGLTCTMRGTAGDDAPTARADADRVRQILLNLLTNAIKFTPAGGQITVSVERDPDAPSAVHVRVQDTGIGIPAARLESVFEPFVQVHRGHLPGEGVGLGLSISRQMARAMGGELTVASAPDVGSLFTLRLPDAG